jgi:hypothetical protein
LTCLMLLTWLMPLTWLQREPALLLLVLVVSLF